MKNHIHTPSNQSPSGGGARHTSRRGVLQLLTGAGFASFVPGLACSGAGNTAGTRDTGDGSSSSGNWAIGGTAAMTGKAAYPNPFTAPLGACALIASTTQGPCTTQDELVREDVSEGWAGLPVRLALAFVNASCESVSGASVKIWHTTAGGSYSGQTPNNAMCLKDQALSSKNLFRGSQVTDDSGAAFFDTCFPGWYPGRAVHIHFQVTQGSTVYRVSQLFFPEEVTREVFSKHDDYLDYGQPDTVFSSDNIMAGISATERERHILAVARMTDGSMLASKVVTVL